MSQEKTVNEVRRFYDSIGWQEESDGFYQNAHYEDLRPVSAEYINRCHLRVNRFIRKEGRFMLDAGSGPVQYPQYLTYSEGYDYRVCADLSIVALKEARKRLGDKGLFVVTDVAHLPFKKDAFDGMVSLHTLHHLNLENKKKAWLEFFRVLNTNSSGVVVNGWTDSLFMRRSQRLVHLVERVANRLSRRNAPKKVEVEKAKAQPEKVEDKPTGTFIEKMNAEELEAFLNENGIKFEIHSWRSVNVRFMRALVHKFLFGKLFLRFTYWLEEKYPELMGKKGQYPLVVFRK